MWSASIGPRSSLPVTFRTTLARDERARPSRGNSSRLLQRSKVAQPKHGASRHKSSRNVKSNDRARHSRDTRDHYAGAQNVIARPGRISAPTTCLKGKYWTAGTIEEALIWPRNVVARRGIAMARARVRPSTQARRARHQPSAIVTCAQPDGKRTRESLAATDGPEIPCAASSRGTTVRPINAAAQHVRNTSASA